MDVNPIPLSRAAAPSDQAAEGARARELAKAEREFHAMLLREMLRPLMQALFGSDGQSSSGPQPFGSAGNETYGYFLEQALSQQLSQAWPLPSPFGEDANAARALGSIGSSPTTMPLRTAPTPIPMSMQSPTSVRGAESIPLPASVRTGSISVPTSAQATRSIPLPTSVRTERSIPLPASVRINGSSTPLPASVRAAGSTSASVRSERADLHVQPTSQQNAASLALDAPFPSSDREEHVPPGNADGALQEASAIRPPSPRASVGAESGTESSTSGVTTQWVSTDDGAHQRETFALPEAEIRRASRLFDLPENLVRAVILTESGGRADAVSPKGAVGYMQVLPSTGKEMGASDVRDPWQNLYAGAKYLRKQLDRFGNLEHALAAYNAGPGAVERHAGIPPYRETRRYVQRVLSWMSRLDQRGS